jgi:serine/threonine protein kinase
MMMQGPQGSGAHLHALLRPRRSSTVHSVFHVIDVECIAPPNTSGTRSPSPLRGAIFSALPHSHQCPQDVYSLGVLLWELYHGKPPWRAKKHKARKVAPRQLLAPGEAPPPRAEAAAKAANDEFWDDPDYRLRACDVLEISPNCPARYAAVLRRCLSADPRDRPGARSVVKALLRMERSMAAAAATSTGNKPSMVRACGSWGGCADAGAAR